MFHCYVRLPECRCSIFSVSQLPKHFVRNVKFSHPPAPKRRVRPLSEESSWKMGRVFLGPRQVAGTPIYLQENKEKGARKHKKSCSWSRISAILVIFSQIFDTFSQVTACWKDRYPLGIGPNPPALQQYRLHPEVIHPPQWACYPCCRTHPRAWQDGISLHGFENTSWMTLDPLTFSAFPNAPLGECHRLAFFSLGVTEFPSSPWQGPRRKWGWVNLGTQCDTSLAFQTLHQFGHCSIWRLKDNQQLALSRLSFLCSLRPHPSQQKPSEQHCLRITSIIWQRRKESVCAIVIGISLNLYQLYSLIFPCVWMREILFWRLAFSTSGQLQNSRTHSIKRHVPRVVIFGLCTSHKIRNLREKTQTHLQEGARWVDQRVGGWFILVLKNLSSESLWWKGVIWRTCLES